MAFEGRACSMTTVNCGATTCPRQRFYSSALSFPLLSSRSLSPAEAGGHAPRLRSTPSAPSVRPLISRRRAGAVASVRSPECFRYRTGAIFSLLRSPNQIYSGSLRRYLPNHSTSAKVIPHEEDLWVDREHHLTLLAWVVSLGHLQRPLDALSQQRHLVPSGAAPNLYGDLYHSLLLSYRPVKQKSMAGCEANASARWLSFCRPCSHFSGWTQSELPSNPITGSSR